MTQQSDTKEDRGGGLRPGAVAALIAVMAAGVVALVPVLPKGPAGGPLRLTLWMVVALSAATELAAVHRHGDRHSHTLSLSEITLVIGLAFAAPLTLVAGRAIAGLAVYGLYRRQSVLKLGFNTVLFALETAAAAMLFHAVLGGTSPAAPRGWLAAAAGIAAATVVGLGAVGAILALHAAAPPSSGGISTTALSLAMTTAGTALGILAVGALLHRTAAFVVIVVAAALAYAAVRTITDQLDSVVRRDALTAALAGAADPDGAARLALIALRSLLRVGHVEAVVPGGQACVRLHIRGDGGPDVASMGLGRCRMVLGALEGASVRWGRALPREIALELASRGFSRPVVAVVDGGSGPVGYLAAGSKRSPERRLSRADRATLGLAARLVGEACRRAAVA